MVRKIPLKKLEPPVKTFNDFAVALTKIIVNAGGNSDEVHIVFDTYKEDYGAFIMSKFKIVNRT
jgi:hypothetical protein